MDLVGAMKVTGKLKITKIDEFGNKSILLTKNLVVNGGLSWIAGRLVDTGTDPGHTIPGEISAMKIGTSSTAEAGGQTDLISPVATQTTLDSVNVSGNTVQFSATYGPSNPGTEEALKEAGLFTGTGNVGGGDIMVCRTVFPIVTKQTPDTIIINWNLTISAS